MEYLFENMAGVCPHCQAYAAMDPESRIEIYPRYAHLDEEPHEGRGGLDGLIEQFERGGLGDVIGSWIGHGSNRPVQPQQLASALGPDTIDTLERQTGLDRDTLLTQLAQVLPEVVHQLTPQGRLPGEEDRRNW